MTSTRISNRRRHRQSKQQTRLHKRQRKVRRNGPLPVHEYSKWLEMRRNDREDIERNRIHIRTMVNLLHSILQVTESSSSADPVATPHTPTPAAGDIDGPFVTSKQTDRQALSDIKDEEVEEESDDGGEETYGDLASFYLKHFLSPHRHVVENHYGIRRYGGNLMIGDSIIRVDRESNLTIKGKHYKGTRGLWELLARKDVNTDVITESDLKKYKTILETNAHLEGFEPGNDILIVRGPKFSKVISRLFPQTKRSVHWVTY